jgi:hypothetical protein
LNRFHYGFPMAFTGTIEQDEAMQHGSSMGR